MYLYKISVSFLLTTGSYGFVVPEALDVTRFSFSP